MPEKADISRAVKAPVAAYGRNAERVAQQRAQTAAVAGSQSAALTWRQIAEAIRQEGRKVGTAPAERC